MSVNFANLFMGQFETNMLNDNKSKYNKLPGTWLRYIDDIFFSLGIMTKPAQNISYIFAKAILQIKV